MRANPLLLIGPSGLALLGLLGAAPAPAQPAVARPSFPIDGEIQTKGLVFFVRAGGPAGAAAIGTAHTFDVAKLARVRRGDLLLGRSRRVAARTAGFLVPPGRPFNQPGATLTGDYLVYALEEPPEGVRLLELAAGPPAPGARIRLLGVPEAPPHDEDDVFGRVVESGAERIDVELDVPAELRGWGGAPGLDARSGQVVGIVQAVYRHGERSRVILAPVARVREALASPLEGGRGREFAAFDRGAARSGRPAPPHPPPPRGPGSRRRTRTATTGGAYERHAGPLLSGAADETRVRLDIEYPPDRAIVGDEACGTFVAGRALALHGEMRRFDVVVVIDTSRSTVEPSGADINGNGIVGQSPLGPIGSLLALSSDRGDSVLAAEVAAARQLLRGLDPRSTRVGVVTFAGEPPDMQGGGGLFGRRARPPAITLEPLTHDYARIERTLDAVLQRDPEGATHMAAGVDQATIELLGLRGSRSERDATSEKIVLFFTDGEPTLPYGSHYDADNIRAVLRAADRARRAQVRIHSFAIGEAALEGPVATVEMADRTEGYFTPVRDPGELVDVIEQVSFADLQEMSVENATSGKPVETLRVSADGSWVGFLRLQPGANEIRARALASDGTEATRTIRVTMASNAPAPPLPPELVPARADLLEGCLQRIKQVRLAAEAERAEQVRKRLLVEIERERLRARQRADEQRKRLDLEVDEPAP